MILSFDNKQSNNSFRRHDSVRSSSVLMVEGNETNLAEREMNTSRCCGNG